MDSNNEVLTQIDAVLSLYPIIKKKKKKAQFNLEKDGSSYRMSYVDLITEQNSLLNWYYIMCEWEFFGFNNLVFLHFSVFLFIEKSDLFAS